MDLGIGFDRVGSRSNVIDLEWSVIGYFCIDVL